MELESVQLPDECLVFRQERFVLRNAAGNGEVAEALAVAGLSEVVVRGEAHGAELADFVAVVVPAVVVAFGEPRVLFVSAEIAPPLRVVSAEDGDEEV